MQSAPVVIQQPAPVVVSVPQRSGGGCCACALRCLGVTEIVLGVLILIAGIVAVVLTPEVLTAMWQIPMYSALSSGPGIWCGIFLIITGVLGALVREDSSRLLYIVNLICSILATLITLSAMAVAALATVAVVFLDGVPTAILHAITIILAFVAMIITIIHSCACCGGVCSEPAKTQEVLVVQQPGMAALPPSGQPMMTNGPVAMQGSPAVVNNDYPPQYQSDSKM